MWGWKPETPTHTSAEAWKHTRCINHIEIPREGNQQPGCNEWNTDLFLDISVIKKRSERVQLNLSVGKKYELCLMEL